MKKYLLMLLIPQICFASSWECINKAVMSCNTWRMLIPEGYIVASDNSATGGEHGYAMVFIPDTQHTWN